MTKIIIYPLTLALLVLVGVYIVSIGTQTASASAPSGLPASVATSSFQSITANTAELIFATSTCSARVVTTTAADVRLTFSDNQGLRPTSANGHLQLASTTVAYDSGVYGCGAVYVTGLGTQTLTLTESN